MKKEYYIAPASSVVTLNVSGDITEGTIPVGSKFVDSSEIEGKENDFEEEDGDDWGGSGNGFTRNWAFGNTLRQWGEE